MNSNQGYQNKNRMLIIDDDFINREVLKNMFAPMFRFVEAENGQEGLEKIEQWGTELCAILLDVEMPVMNGMQLLDILYARGVLNQVPVFLITSNEELDIARRAYEMGVMGVINKPVVPFIAVRRVELVVELFQARDALNSRVEQQERKLQENVETIDNLHKNTLEAMAAAIEFRDVESGEHTNRIYSITKLLLQKTDMGQGFTEEEIENMAIGSIMHDVGKIAISDVILNKPGKLTRDEFEIMKTHTVKGHELMAQLSASQDHPSYQYAQDIARHHHERWDGRGYPDGLKGDAITVWSQVVSIADVYDALISPRVYKRAFTPDKAVDMICNNECGVFNPRLVECFLKIEPELRLMYQQFAPEQEAVAQPAAAGSTQAINDPMDSILLTAAIRQFYDMIICANLTANTFYILDDDRAQTHCSDKAGVFDDLIISGALSIPESHRQLFVDAFSRESLLRAYREGKRSVNLEHPQFNDQGQLMDVSTSVLLMEDPRNGNVRNITLIRYSGGGHPQNHLNSQLFERIKKYGQ